MTNFLAGQRALVTGAVGGIGRATARALAEQGCRIALADLEQPGLDELLPTLPGSDRRHFTLAFDLANGAACEASVQESCDRMGGLDIVVHAGALLVRQILADVSPETLQAMTAVNMWGSFFITRKSAQLMAERGGGSIVLFSSQGAYTGGYGGSTVYSMTKAALGALVKSVAREYGGRRVRVNGIAPGAIDTAMMRDGISSEGLTRFLEMVPIKRMGTPEEVAACCAFLVGPGSEYVTGQMLHVNGGQLML